MPSLPSRYAVTLTGGLVGHYELDADAITVSVNGSLMLWQDGSVVYCIRAGGWSVAKAIEYSKEKVKEPPA
jgi:hypothetical protein